MTFLRTSASCTPSNFGTPTRFAACAAVVVKSTPATARGNQTRRGGVSSSRVSNLVSGMTVLQGRGASSGGRPPGDLGAVSMLSAAGCATATRGDTGVVFDRTSPYGRVLVIDEGAAPRDAVRLARGLRAERDRCPAIRAPYRSNTCATRCWASPTTAGRARVLMVGLGGGTFTTLVHRALPDATIDAVEIDPVVVEAARALVRPARGRALPGPRRRRRRLAARAIAAPTTTCCSTPTPAKTSRRPLAGEAFFRDVARAAGAGGRRRDQHRGDAGSGVAPARAFAAVFTPFECRRTAVDGNVMLFAAAGPRAADPAADAALAGRLGCARRDRLLAGARWRRCPSAAPRAIGCWAPPSGRGEAVRPGLDAGDLGRRQRVQRRHHLAARTVLASACPAEVPSRDSCPRPGTAWCFSRTASCSCQSGTSPTSRSNGAVIRSRPPASRARLSWQRPG